MNNNHTTPESWTPATEFRVTKLKPSGPKRGQSTTAWLYGKQSEQVRFDRLKRQQNDQARFERTMQQRRAA